MLRRAALAAIALATSIPAGPARAQPAETGGTVRVASISPWTDVDRAFSVGLQITNATELGLDRVTVQISYFSRVTSRSQLRTALDERAPTSLIGTFSVDVPGRIRPGEQRTVSISRPVQEISSQITSIGVHPIEISVRHARGEITVRSAVPHFGSTPDARLNVTWILPVSRPTALRGAGTYSSEALAALAMDELEQQMAEIAGRVGARVTLAVSASLVDALADLGDGFVRRDGKEQSAESAAAPDAARARTTLDALRRAASAAGELASVPYAPADLPSLSRRGLRADLLRQLALGRSVVAGRVRKPPAASLLVPPGLVVDTSSAATLETAGVDAVVLDPGSLAPEPNSAFDPRFGPSRPIRVTGRRAAFDALLADVPLRERLNGTEQGVLLAQALIAETASAWHELPVRAAQRLLVVVSERLPSPSALGAALDGLASAPWAALRTATEALRTLPAQGESVSLSRAPRRDTKPLAAARTARGALGLLDDIAAEDLAEGAQLERLVLLAESAEWSEDESTGIALARAVTARVGAVTRAVRVQPRQITLTSRASEVPVTVLNGNAFPIRVRIRLASARVAFPAGSARTEDIVPPDATLSFSVEALGTGSFPLDVFVETIDGRHEIARGRLTVRSTRVSAVTLAATGGSALFLIVAWARRGVRRRRG